jgi:CheY-like chemotaxis protein/HPt (histidine-containing phosphotransfer) domain-containing protein
MMTSRSTPSLPPELSEELSAVGIAPGAAPTSEQWQALLPRIAGLIRARSFGRDSIALSHELRTPMTVVLGATELLLESELDPEQRAQVQGVHSSGHELLSILNEVLEQPAENPSSIVPPEPEMVETDLHGRVLVVEDNEFNQALIVHALTSVGCEVDTASSGFDALSKLGDQDYDVILMDCHMAGLDGFETTRQLRQLERGAVRVPVIAVTAGGVPGMRRTCLAAGMDDYLAKPFTLAALRNRVAHWMGRAPSRRPLPSVRPSHAPVPKPNAAHHLNLSRLEELAEEAGSPNIAVELTQIFLDDIGRRVQSFQEAAASNDSSACTSLAHAIKGACGNFGAVGMAALAEEAERRAKAGASAEVVSLVQRLAREFDLVSRLLEEHGLVRDASGAPRRRSRRPSGAPPPSRRTP